VKDIQIRVFLFQKENGKSVAEKRNNSGVILIFPKKRGFFHKKIQDNKKEKVRFYLKTRAKTAMIHELLDIKYDSNECK